ncbi:hypothetical protein P4L29_15740 [Bacillus cereus]|nr:hypothetical protein [Bacillus cereus]
MGCDIHAYVEVKRYPYQDEKRENGVWINADKWTVNQEQVLHPEDDQRHMIIDYDDHIYKGRNYYLFATLANVRNGKGFTPISEPKGLPVDVSPEMKKISDYWDRDGHSHSYLTLKELLSFNWDEVIEAAEFYGSEERAREMLGEKITRIIPELLGVTVYYNTTIRGTMSGFMETIDKLKGFLKDHDHPYWKTTEEDIRLVFWFDN